MKSNKKVLHICSYYINDRFYDAFFRHLSVKSYINMPYTFANVNRQASAPKLLGQVSFCFNSLDRFFFYRKHRKVWKDFISYPQLMSCSIIHAHSLFSNGYIAYKIWKKTNTPYIVTIRYPDIFTFFKYMPHLRKIGKEILVNAKAVVFLSPIHMQHIMKYFSPSERQIIKIRTHIIPNGVDDFWLKNRLIQGRPKPPDKQINLLYVGKINRNKNLKLVLKICKLLQKDNYNIKLTIAGELQDIHYQKLMRKCLFVEYVGICSNEELLQLYREANVFVLLSHKESFGLVYAEALTQGLPIIYTKGQGFDGQFAEGQVGHAVSDHKPKQAVKAIKTIYGSYECYSNRALNLCGKFEWNKVVVEIAELYEKYNIQD